MTVLNGLKTMKDTDTQSWLRKVGQDHVQTLVVALLGANEEVKNCVYRNMSENAVTYLKKDLDTMRNAVIQEEVIHNAAAALEELML